MAGVAVPVRGGTKGLDVVILTVAGTSMVVVLVAVRVISLFANKHD